VGFVGNEYSDMARAQAQVFNDVDSGYATVDSITDSVAAIQGNVPANVNGGA
jgi:hypothetical protein